VNLRISRRFDGWCGVRFFVRGAERGAGCGVRFFVRGAERGAELGAGCGTGCGVWNWVRGTKSRRDGFRHAKTLEAG
jgi:hypothetical protein